MPLPTLKSSAATYGLAVALPLGMTALCVRFELPAYVFEHLMVLLVVAFAVGGCRGPALTVGLVGSIGDNILLREPVGRPAITGMRDAVDFALFVAVAATVGWL